MDLPTTLRSAVCKLQILGETPTGWALNPTDAQAVDLLRWSTGGGLLSITATPGSQYTAIHFTETLMLAGLIPVGRHRRRRPG